MDEIDHLILQTLQGDGRTPFTQIAKRAGVSESTIRSRYRNLVMAGVLHTVSIVDPYALDFQAPAMIGIHTDPARVEQVAEAVAALPEVSYLVMTLGEYDLIAEIFCRDLPHLTEVLVRQVQCIPGVRSLNTLMVAKVYKLSYRWSPAEFDESERDDNGRGRDLVKEA
jgi:Lrp/AsnC family transcriptional regulator for asnA, asnC and gidA